MVGHARAAFLELSGVLYCRDGFGALAAVLVAWRACWTMAT